MISHYSFEAMAERRVGPPFDSKHDEEVRRQPAKRPIVASSLRQSRAWTESNYENVHNSATSSAAPRFADQVRVTAERPRVQTTPYEGARYSSYAASSVHVTPPAAFVHPGAARGGIHSAPAGSTSWQDQLVDTQRHRAASASAGAQRWAEQRLSSYRQTSARDHRQVAAPRTTHGVPPSYRPGRSLYAGYMASQDARRASQTQAQRSTYVSIAPKSTEPNGIQTPPVRRDQTAYYRRPSHLSISTERSYSSRQAYAAAGKPSPLGQLPRVPAGFVPTQGFTPTSVKRAHEKVDESLPKLGTASRLSSKSEEESSPKRLKTGEIAEENKISKLDLLCSATLELGPLQENPTGCSCPRSNCIKLYCDCFKAGRQCSAICSCHNCKNTAAESGLEGERTRAIKNILARNPRAFTGGKKESSPRSPGDVVCNCVKSRCLKLYCDCFHNGKTCTDACSCVLCLNTVKESGEGGKRKLAMQYALEKRPDAFTVKPREIGAGCACKNNRCLKKYCDCFRFDLKCTDKCNCRECGNREGGTQVVAV